VYIRIRKTITQFHSLSVQAKLEKILHLYCENG
jgi:hypothetical protein